MTDIRNFIDENNISFAKGERNSTVTTLVGYAQHLGLGKDKFKEEIDKEISKDSFIEEEVDRLWKYCKDKGYKNYWKSPEAKVRYTFI